MSIPEKRQGLEVDGYPGWQNQGVDFDPRYFSKGALREIIRYQMFSDQPKEFMIVGQDSIAVVRVHLLERARKYESEERREFLNVLAEQMIIARRVILHYPPKQDGRSS